MARKPPNVKWTRPATERLRLGPADGTLISRANRCRDRRAPLASTCRHHMPRSHPWACPPTSVRQDQPDGPRPVASSSRLGRAQRFFLCFFPLRGGLRGEDDAVPSRRTLRGRTPEGFDATLQALNLRQGAGSRPQQAATTSARMVSTENAGTGAR